jgi:hypothetical protein
MYVLHLRKTYTEGPLDVELTRVHHDGSLEPVDPAAFSARGGDGLQRRWLGGRVKRADVEVFLSAVVDHVAKDHVAMHGALINLAPDVQGEQLTTLDLAALDIYVVPGSERHFVLDRYRWGEALKRIQQGLR